MCSVTNEIVGLRDSQDLNNLVPQYSDLDCRLQVVAVGTPLPTSSVPAGDLFIIIIFSRF